MTDPVTEKNLDGWESDKDRVDLAAQNKCSAEAWICINEAGDFQVGADEEQAAENFAANYGGDRRRTFRLRLTLPLPVVTEATGEVPDAEGNAFNVEVRPE
jgi:hypothetical protein